MTFGDISYGYWKLHFASSGLNHNHFTISQLQSLCIFRGHLNKWLRIRTLQPLVPPCLCAGVEVKDITPC